MQTIETYLSAMMYFIAKTAGPITTTSLTNLALRGNVESEREFWHGQKITRIRQQARRLEQELDSLSELETTVMAWAFAVAHRGAPLSPEDIDKIREETPRLFADWRGGLRRLRNLRKGRVGRPADIGRATVAFLVAVALREAGVPLAKSRDGKLARVLKIVLRDISSAWTFSTSSMSHRRAETNGGV